MQRPLYQSMALLVQALANCRKSDQMSAWEDRHEARMQRLVKNHLPSGSGWDCGTTWSDERSTANKLVFWGSYHHMDESGGYAGWTEHTITVTADLAHGFQLKISGRDRNQIKDYLHDLFDSSLRRLIDEKLEFAE